MMKLRVFLSFFLLTTICFNTNATEIIDVKNIKLLSMNYSSAEVEIDFIYDGSIGDNIFFGATPITNERISESSFRPNLLRKGENKSVVLLMRPEVIHHDAFSTHSIDFIPYSRNITKHVEIPFVIQWASYEQKFSAIAVAIDTTKQFKFVESIRINEALYSSAKVIKALRYFGITENQLDVIYVPIRNTSSKSISLRVAEGGSLSDIKLLIKVLNPESISIRNIGFLAKESDEYKFGFVDILEFHADGLGRNTDQILKAINESNDLKHVYEVANFTPTDKLLSQDELLEKATGLIRIGGHVLLSEAISILNVLISTEYYHPLVFLEYAKAILKRNSFDPQIVLFFVVLVIFIGSFYYKKYLIKPDFHTITIDNDDPLIQAQIEVSKKQIHRFVDGLGQGKLEAMIKFPLATDKDGKRVWGVAHTQKSDNIIASVDDIVVDSNNADENIERLSIPIKDIEDWMLIEKSGKTHGGYSVLAHAQIYEKKHGKLPAKYAKKFKSFVDISWPSTT